MYIKISRKRDIEKKEKVIFPGKSPILWPFYKLFDGSSIQFTLDKEREMEREKQIR